MEFIDATPTWIGIMPMLMEIYEQHVVTLHKTRRCRPSAKTSARIKTAADGRDYVRGEIARLCRTVDAQNARIAARKARRENMCVVWEREAAHA